MGGVMQLITKIAVVAVGAWGMRNLDVVWLGWPLLCGRNRDPVLLLSEDRAGNGNRIKQKAPPESKSLSGGAVY